MEGIRDTAQKFVLATTLALLIAYQKLFFSGPEPLISEAGDVVLLLVGAFISHEGLHAFVFRVLNASETFQKAVWGERYLTGFWVFTSRAPTGEVLRGVWRIEQDLHTARIVGFGLDDQLSRRARVHSVSPIIQVKGLYEVINQRNDWSVSKEASFSTSVFSLDAPVRRGLFRYATTFRGETQIFGGPRSGTVLTSAVWKKVEHARTEEDVLDMLRKEMMPSSEKTAEG